MALSRIAREMAAEIAAHDWSDSPYRVDKAGHRREDDTGPKRSRNVLEEDQEMRVRANVCFVTAQVLGHAGLITPGDLAEYAAECGLNVRINRVRAVPGWLHFGIRWTGENGAADAFAPPALSIRERDRLEGQRLLHRGPWTEVELDDETLVELDGIEEIPNTWLKWRQIDLPPFDSALRAHLIKNCHTIRENPEEPHTVKWIHLGELRGWFEHYLSKQGVE